MTTHHHDRDEPAAGGGQEYPVGFPVLRDHPVTPQLSYAPDRSRRPEPLLTVRSAVVLLVAIVVGVLAGGLSYLADHSVPAAVLWGGGAAGSTIPLFHTIIGR